MRLVFLSNVFPSPIAPTKGTFNLAMVRALAGEHDVRVVCPLAWTMEWNSRWKGLRIPPSREMSFEGIQTSYPRFWYPPRLVRDRYDAFLEWSVRNTLRKVEREARPEAVLSYWAHPDGTVALRWARRLGIPAWIMVGGSDVLLLAGEHRRRRAIAATLRQADGVVAVSEDIRRHVISLGVPDDKVHVIYRGVDRRVFCPGNRLSARQGVGVPVGIPMFLWVGRMVTVKGLDALLNAADALSRRHKEFLLCLVGEGRLKGLLTQQILERGLTKQVRIIGSIAHECLPDWYRAADWTILTSHSEGMPNVLLESHACGTPFISTDVGGVAEVALEGIDRLVPAGNLQALTSAMEDTCDRLSFEPATIAASVPTLQSAAREVARLIEGGGRQFNALQDSASTATLV